MNKVPMSPGEAFAKVYGTASFSTETLKQAFYEVFVAGWNACNRATIARWTEEITEDTNARTN